jgi:hypothetical protein
MGPRCTDPHFRLPGHELEVSGQLHDPAALPRKTATSTRFTWSWMGPEPVWKTWRRGLTAPCMAPWWLARDTDVSFRTAILLLDLWFSRRWLRRMPSSKLVYFCSVLGLLVTATLFLARRLLSPWWLRWYVPPKRRLLHEPQGATSQKTVFFRNFLITVNEKKNKLRGL